ncbi:hypothetical protein AB9K35_17925 [Leisingera sp. XS_AS12]|uniref:hypothetical protein n=1 Tax=Leisingera sp. XS_AS12 TaxID=3241294 RepID=UPI00351646B4
MFKPYDPPREPLFDVEILRRNITADWVKAQITATLERHMAGDKLHFHERLPSFDEIGTDEALSKAIPHPVSRGPLQDKILDILGELRGLGLLQPVPHGEDRQSDEAIEWNAFVANGSGALGEDSWDYIFNLPMARAIGEALWSGGQEAIYEGRKAAGLNPFSGRTSSERTGDKRLMEYTDELIDAVASSAVVHMEGCATGVLQFYQVGGEMTCRKTDQRLGWASGRLLNPALGAWHHPKPGEKGRSRFELLGAYDAPKPIRHVEIEAPSGVILMADWFRIPGFNEGVKHDITRGPSISSDLGVDKRTQDHYERLGLVRVHTTNCLPRISRDGELIRIGHFNEDHEDLWEDDPTAPYGQRFREELVPDEIGSICCDLWDVTFADREVLADILIAGGEVIAANDGVGEHGRPVEGAPRTREEALALLDAYSQKDTVAKFDVEPGAPLHLYMATGNRVSQFHEHFRSPDVSRHDWLEDMFILSPRPLDVAAELVDEADWAWPDRYSSSRNEEIEP